MSASIIVPTYREAANIETLANRIFETARKADIDIELILVDDNSQDGTEAAVEKLQDIGAIRLIVRKTQRGLSGAVLEGFRQAQSDRFVVMDADLQHPPEAFPALLAKLDSSDCDFVLASRYGQGGGVDSHWPLHRRLISWLATSLAKPIAPLSDPMSGYFGLTRTTWERAVNLNPIGYKIALELYVKCGCQSPCEVPIRFSSRLTGESKLNFGVQLAYARHLLHLYRYRWPKATMVVAFMLLGSAILAVAKLLG